MQNPFTLTFGKSPLEPVERPVQTKEIIDTSRTDQSADVYYYRSAWVRKDCNDD